ncbi:hypothetical protein J2R76_002494 [Bradyrhizobium sp. USDA 4532]|uniref:hypothetical protein n=1 Tax=unclassified Bradyrhizobium TaxID=2631580 RepID=UPI0020A1AA98|nr:MULTISPECIES: hypothetical protein [unclassified Bradyrhizobium]MCP1834157.1 hypothetical protein [Bradyrhizobium sp. USDA 4545]MCP1918903.1 hypothetical protein [Bradyrhizobium sp. USDA 4532]
MDDVSKATLYDLFEATSLQNCKRLLDAGEIPTPQQLADILSANAHQALPAWFLDLVAKGLRGELKRRAGRPKERLIQQIRFAAASADYGAHLSWLIKRDRSSGLGGWSILRDQDWWSGPPHERAAKIVIRKWRLPISWRSFLNRISSDK